MTSISYEDIFANFLGSVQDYDIANMDFSMATTLMVEFLKKTVSKSYVRRLFTSISLDDELETVTFEMEHTVDDDSDIEFVIDILARGMVVEWLQPQVKSKLLTAQLIGSDKERTFFSQANHLSELRSLLEDVKKELRDSIRDRGFIYNSYLGDS